MRINSDQDVSVGINGVGDVLKSENYLERSLGENLKGARHSLRVLWVNVYKTGQRKLGSTLWWSTGIT